MKKKKENQDVDMNKRGQRSIGSELGYQDNSDRENNQGEDDMEESPPTPLPRPPSPSLPIAARIVRQLRTPSPTPEPA